MPIQTRSQTSLKQNWFLLRSNEYSHRLVVPISIYFIGKSHHVRIVLDFLRHFCDFGGISFKNLSDLFPPVGRSAGIPLHQFRQFCQVIVSPYLKKINKINFTMIWTLGCTFGELKGIWAFGWILGYLGLWENLGTGPIFVFYWSLSCLTFQNLLPPPPSIPGCSYAWT
jgi:hypothetical protein